MEDSIDLSPQQAECLISPVRECLLKQIQINGPIGVGDLSECTGVAEKSIYYHLRILEKVGLIKFDSWKQTATKPEALYVPTARQFRSITEGDDKSRSVSCKRVKSLLRRIEKQFEEASQDDNLTILIQNSHFRLSEDDQEAFRQKMLDIAIWANSRAEEGGDLVSYSAFMIPLQPTSSKMQK